MSEDELASYHVLAACLGANNVTRSASVGRVVQIVTIIGGMAPKANAPA
jgi:hypothetical protein